MGNSPARGNVSKADKRVAVPAKETPLHKNQAAVKPHINSVGHRLHGKIRAVCPTFIINYPLSIINYFPLPSEMHRDEDCCADHEEDYGDKLAGGEYADEAAVGIAAEKLEDKAVDGVNEKVEEEYLMLRLTLFIQIIKQEEQGEVQRSLDKLDGKTRNVVRSLDE